MFFVIKVSLDTKQQLQIRVDKYTDKNRTECDYCKKNFSTKRALITHLKIHTGKNVVKVSLRSEI